MRYMSGGTLSNGLPQAPLGTAAHFSIMMSPAALQLDASVSADHYDILQPSPLNAPNKICIQLHVMAQH